MLSWRLMTAPHTGHAPPRRACGGSTPHYLGTSSACSWSISAPPHRHPTGQCPRARGAPTDGVRAASAKNCAMENGELEKRTENRFPKLGDTTAKDGLFRTTHSVELRASIEAVYSQFATARLSDPLRYCSHCFTDDDARYLAAKKPRELTFADIAFILPKSISTLGTAADFNYFLPRILEALAYGAHYMEHVLPKKLGEARMASWTTEQTSALVRFFVAFIAAINEAEFPELFSYDIEHILPELKAVLPELPGGLALRGLGNPRAGDS